VIIDSNGQNNQYDQWKHGRVILQQQNGIHVWGMMRTDCQYGVMGLLMAIIATRKSKDRHYNDQNKNNKKD
jgi:predicted histidine transporter YuiF (NhaC family)